MKESSFPKETRLYQLLQAHKQSFLDVRTRLGLDESVGYGVCPAAHQGTGEYPFLILPLKAEDGVRKTFTTVVGYSPGWHNFDELLDFHKHRGWKTFAGHEIVAPRFSNTKAGEQIVHFASFFIHPDWPSGAPPWSIGTIHRAYSHMPKEAFQGGLVLLLAKIMDQDYIKIIVENWYVDACIKHLEYMQKLIIHHFRIKALPIISDVDVSEERFSEELLRDFRGKFPNWGGKIISNSLDEELLRKLREYCTELNKLREYQ